MRIFDLRLLFEMSPIVDPQRHATPLDLPHKSLCVRIGIPKPHRQWGILINGNNWYLDQPKVRQN